MKTPKLVYVHADQRGWRRVRRGRGFSYVTPSGAPVRDANALQRIRQLAIPPAYTDVWICPNAHGHLQATGRDARGRKQYRYHPAWQAQQDQHKFDRMHDFGKALSRIRRAVARHLRGGELGMDTVVATIVRLLDRTAMRVGNEAYMADNGSFGLTTLRNRHVHARAGELLIAFRGKSGIEQKARLKDPQAARIVRRCQELPGQHLFQYIDETGQRHAVRSTHVNTYLRRVSGHDFTAKDFRTWNASVQALELLMDLCPQPPADPRGAKAHWNEVVRQVARQIGNTQTVCRKFYIHPAVQQCLEKGAADWPAPARTPPLHGLRNAERALLRLLGRPGRGQAS
ncbi:DNA topoisomerase-1 [Hydrogenophaga palleronii]|uniref:DNA topoisomerase n=1 Tax=Hydrogenophaga palleronii TaxID=65655 RepID=A0ABU1WT79_9BURK|nr:DNA topoisomerase IB [Hydrogenophaga palleronii]MDR7152242.1 DNA topoisomerase-1 [Hydrogenophaga palleronii]